MKFAGRAIAGVLMLGLGLVAGGQAAGPATGSAGTRAAMTVGEIRGAIEKLRPLHATMPATRPGDWLEKHPEAGQTFEEYAKGWKPLTENLTTIYVQPIGDFSKAQERLIDDTTEFLGVFYSCPVKKLEAIPLSDIPETARRTHLTWGDKQILTGYVEEMLVKRRPKDAVAVLALTTSDLWPGEGWNFVFGEASLYDRVGVWSVYRFGDPEKDYTQVLRRTLKVASHETGHMLGIPHCTAYLCGMNGSNNLPEADRQPMGFCPECDGKVWYACRCDAAARYRALAGFAGRHELKAEGEGWEREAEVLRK